MKFVAPYGQKIRYTGGTVVLSATPPERRIEKGALGTVIGPAHIAGFVKVQFDGVDGSVAVRESSLEEISDDAR